MKLTRIDFLWIGLFLLSSISLIRHAAAEPIRRGLLNYVDTANESRLDAIAGEFEIAIGTDSANALRRRSPDFQFYTYNSITDNYVSSTSGTREHDALAGHFVWRALDPEDIYLHYAVDTVTTIQGEKLTVPGWPHGSATHRAESRVPVYYKNLSRRLVAFHRPDLRRVQREFHVKYYLEKPIAKTRPSVYPQGLFLDNCGTTLYNYGTIHAGGWVAETRGSEGDGPEGMLRINDPAFHKYGWYQQGLFAFTRELRAYLDEHPVLLPRRGQETQARLILNTAWDEDFADPQKPPVAHCLFLEFQWNPARNWGQAKTIEFYKQNVASETVGIETWGAGFTQHDFGDRGSFTYDEMFQSVVAMYWALRAERSIVFIGNVNGPAAVDWEQRCLRAVTRVDLGTATGEPSAYKMGTDPDGHPYTIVAREFSNGFALIRNRGNWNETVLPSTAVTFDLPRRLYAVDVQGKAGQGTSSWTLRNGQGQIFLKDPEQAPIPAAAPQSAK